MEGKLTITFDIDNDAYRLEDGTLDYMTISGDLNKLADKIKEGNEIASMCDINGASSVSLKWEYDNDNSVEADEMEDLSTPEKIAKEMARISKILIAGDVNDRNTYNQITKTKTTMPQFKQLKKVFQSNDETEESDIDDLTYKVAEELLEISKELMN